MSSVATDKAVLSAREFLKKSSKSEHGLNRWSYVGDSGERRDDYGPCWAGIYPNNGYVVPPGGVFVATFMGQPETPFGKYAYGDKSREFLNVLVGPESPWRQTVVPCLVVKDPDEIHEDRGFVFDVQEVNYLLLMNFLIATRMVAEWSSKFSVYETLRESGVSRIDSYVTAQFFEPCQNKFRVVAQGGHQPFSSFPMFRLVDRLRSGKPNGISRNFTTGLTVNPLTYYIPPYYSSPFYSNSPDPVLLKTMPSQVSLKTLKKYPSALSDTSLPENVKERLSFVEDFWSHKPEPVVEPVLKKKRSLKQPSEELDF